MATSYPDSKCLAALGQQIANQGSLIPEPSTPFYIVSPAYTRISAGVKVLHTLCHYLNVLGERAFMVIDPMPTVGNAAWPHFAQFGTVRPDNCALNTPLLTADVAEFHFRQGLTPVCIYPEVMDDPLSAPFIARYILNYPGALAPKYRTPYQFTMSYSRRLADAVGKPKVLHLPMVDLNLFKDRGLKRSGTCYYAGKYKQIHGGDLSILPKNSREILRSDRMTQEEVREIFCTSELLYCFEDTALAIEACLCGCAVAFVPNEHLVNGTIASHELGNDGMAWGTNAKEIKRAMQTVHKVRDVIEGLYAKVPSAIADFVAEVKPMAQKVAYETPVKLPYDLRQVYVATGRLPVDLRDW